MDEWVRVDADRRPARSGGPPGISARPAQPVTTLDPEIAAEIRNATGGGGASAKHRENLVAEMADAVTAYDRGRYQEAWRLGQRLARELPGVAAVRELGGLAAYRSGRWAEARRQLEAHRELTGVVDHVPEVMDSIRALGRPNKVAELWNELRHLSAAPDVLAEARIVAAATLADRGDLSGAITLLAGATKSVRNPADRHLRQWYALADLYERAGDVPRARELFSRVQQHDPEAYDVPARLAALGTGRRRRPARRHSG